MLQLMVKILSNNPNSWVLQVSSNSDSLPRPYFFQKDGFTSAGAAKSFFVANIRLFSIQMGEL